MTAVSTLVGFMPLLIASGAGAVSRWSLGTAVFGGMLVATVLSLIFVPILYIVIKNFEQSFLKGGRKKDGGTRGRGDAERELETDTNGDNLNGSNRQRENQQETEEQESNINN